MFVKLIKKYQILQLRLVILCYLNNLLRILAQESFKSAILDKSSLYQNTGHVFRASNTHLDTWL